ncbi:MAG: hypothetical protein A2Y15_06320 [Clostridiales bacterium GWF2_36_10]|nr:MAG: hypothetical protein A2Y15_06320 [Clostridiales bacterium GWF2_36_10]HAN21867.1 B12-binding domain-containing radical SAM protein [Clostridiales bacterium]
MKLNVVICALNSQYIHSSLAPWCLLAGIKVYCKDNISAHIIEGTINEKTEVVLARITEKNPHVVGFSCYIWNITAIYELINLVKSLLPNIIIVLGGPEVSYNAETIFNENQSVDYIISGEGEKPFALLLNSINERKDVQGLPGLCYRIGNNVIISKPYNSDQEPPTPYTKEYFETLNGRISYLETSRGCPYSCAFCLSGRCGNVRFFDIEKAKNEIILLANSGTQTVKLVDRTFNANKKRTYEIIEFIINNYNTKIPKGVCFHFEIAGDILDEETINLLSTAPVGAIQLEIGLQSFNPKTLESVNRKTNIVRLKNNIKQIIKNANMHIHIDLIAGLPYEDLRSFEESFNAAFELKPHMLQLGFLKLLHGSAMRNDTKRFPCEYTKESPYEVISTPWLSKQDFTLLHSTEEALNRLYNSGRFRRTLEYLLIQCGYSPFRLFTEFGEFVYGKQSSSLDEYSFLIFDYFSAKKNCDRIKLRDLMVCDRLSTNSTGLLPDFLRVKDLALSKIKAKLDNDPATRQQKGVKRGLALLYSQPYAVYVDYNFKNKNPITGEYKLKKLRINEINENFN